MTEADVLAGLPGLGLAFGLVLCRIGMAVMLLPGLGEAEPPATVRAGLALSITLLLLPAVAARVPQAGPDGFIPVAAMIGTELLAGAILGWLARLPAIALSMAGAFVSYMLGLSSVVQPDPSLGGQSAALARLFGMVAPVLILSSGLYALPLSALAESYDVMAPGGAIAADGLADIMVRAVGASFGLAVRLAAPFLLSGVIWQAALGLLARLVPQLQIYTAAAPGQILGGMVLLSVLASGLLGVWNEAVSASWAGLPGL